MITKVYAIDGKSSVEIELKVGKARIPLVFAKGCLDRKNYRPATLTVSQKALQNIIEDSPYFGKLISIWKVYGVEDESVEAKEENPAPASEAPASVAEANDITEYPEVTSREAMLVILKSLGAKATTLADDKAIKGFIAKKKISFPNFNF